MGGGRDYVAVAKYLLIPPTSQPPPRPSQRDFNELRVSIPQQDIIKFRIQMCGDLLILSQIEWII